MADNEYNCIRVKMRDKSGKEFYALYDKSRQLLFLACMTVEWATRIYGFEFIEERTNTNEN